MLHRTQVETQQASDLNEASRDMAVCCFRSAVTFLLRRSEPPRSASAHAFWFCDRTLKISRLQTCFALLWTVLSWKRYCKWRDAGELGVCSSPVSVLVAHHLLRAFCMMLFVFWSVSSRIPSSGDTV